MSITNTAAFPQFRLNSSAVATAANTAYNSTATVVLLHITGPDGGILTKLSAMPRATISTSTQCQLFTSKDGGSTFNLVNNVQTLSTVNVTASTAITMSPFTQVDGTVLSESNSYPLQGRTTYAAAGTTPLYGGLAGGTADALTLPLVPSTQAIATGQIVYFTSSATNATTTPTLQVGTLTAKTILRESGAAIVAGDISVGDGGGYRYGAYYDGTNWRLFLTMRLYVGISAALAGGVLFNAQIQEY